MKRLVIAACLMLVIKSIGVDKIPSTKYSRKEIKCLVDNIYYEARGEPFEGQILVGVVTLNRAENGKICNAVYAPNQFSWTRMGFRHRPRDIEAYRASFDAAMYSFTGKYGEDILYFHSRHIRPKWVHGKVFYKRIGNHIFYTERNK